MKRILCLLILLATSASAQQYANWPPTSGGSVTSITAGTGLTGGTITTSGTIALAVPVTPADGGTGSTTAFTAGSVVFAGASGVYSQDNANFFWDDTNHRLGIGTSAPSVPLQVDGTYTTVDALDGPIMITTTVTAHANNDTPTGLYVNPTFATGGHSGVTPAAATLSGNSALALSLQSDGNNGDIMEAFDQGVLTYTMLTNGQIWVDGLGEGTALNPSIASQGDEHTGIIILPGEVGFSTASTMRMQINGNGVGIGTVSPEGALDVHAGTIRYGTTYASGSPPVACSSTVDGLTFLSTTYHLCVCKGATPAYVLVSDGATSCS